MSPAWFTRAVVAVMLVIAVVDAYLGSTAEYLNGYEILRRTFGLAPTCDRYVLGQDLFGSAALAWGWLLWIAEATAVTGLLYGLARALGWSWSWLVG